MGCKVQNITMQLTSEGILLFNIFIIFNSFYILNALNI